MSTAGRAGPCADSLRRQPITGHLGAKPGPVEGRTGPENRDCVAGFDGNYGGDVLNDVSDSADSGRSPDPGVPRCHCGQSMTRCGGCRTPRCLDCDPYRSDDCNFGL